MKRKYLPRIVTRRDRDGLRRHRAQRRAPTPRASRPARRSTATAGSSTAGRCGPPTPSTPTRSCCSRARAPRDPAKPLEGHDALLRRLRPHGDHGAPDPQARPGRRRLQRDLHRQPGDPRRGRGGRRWARASTTCSTRSTPSASSSASRRSGIGRAALDRAVAVRQGARRLRPADRQEPGDRPSAGPCVGRARRGRDDVPQGGLALRQRPALRRARPTPPSCSPPRPASMPATRRCRPSAATATPRSSTSSGCGARSASTRSRRCRSRWRSTTWPSTCSGCRAPTEPPGSAWT